jgi:hypothetical protein
MAQRSLHAITRVNYRSMSCLAMVSRQTDPTCSVKVSRTKQPLLHHVVQAVHKECHKVWCHPHSTKHDTQPIAYLISKQVIPYRRRGGTCCPGVSTPKIRYLADSSMTNHITWWNPTVSTTPTLLKPQHWSSPRSNHISLYGGPYLTKTQGKLNITKDGKTCTTLMTAWLSITNQVWTQILSMRLRYSIKACRPMCTLEKEREHIGSIWSRVTCLALPLATTQSLKRQAPGDSRSLQRLTISIRNKQHKQINK